MPHFIFAYHGGKTPETPEETEVEIGRWQSWFDNIGDTIIGRETRSAFQRRCPPPG